MSEERFSHTSDDRTANNAFRHQYRVLSEEQKAQMEEVKDLAATFTSLLHRIGRTTPPSSPEEEHRFGSENLSLSFRHIEDAVFRAVKHITR